MKDDKQKYIELSQLETEQVFLGKLMRGHNVSAIEETFHDCYLAAKAHPIIYNAILLQYGFTDEDLDPRDVARRVLKEEKDRRNPYYLPAMLTKLLADPAFQEAALRQYMIDISDKAKKYDFLDIKDLAETLKVSYEEFERRKYDDINSDLKELE